MPACCYYPIRELAAPPGRHLHRPRRNTFPAGDDCIGGLQAARPRCRVGIGGGHGEHAGLSRCRPGEPRACALRERAAGARHGAHRTAGIRIAGRSAACTGASARRCPAQPARRPAAGRRSAAAHPLPDLPPIAVACMPALRGRCRFISATAGSTLLEVFMFRPYRWFWFMRQSGASKPSSTKV